MSAVESVDYIGTLQAENDDLHRQLADIDNEALKTVEGAYRHLLDSLVDDGLRDAMIRIMELMDIARLTTDEKAELFSLCAICGDEMFLDEEDEDDDAEDD